MSENSNSDDNGYDSKKDESFEITIPEFPFEPDDAYSYYENDNIRVKTKLEKGEKLPNLPPVPEQHAPGTIPLAILLQYVCQKINQELFSMTEVVCKTTDVGKKVSLVQFVYITKNLLSKVLAIVKWFRYFKRYRLCIPIQNFLDQQLQQYRDTADALCGIARGELTYARMPQYNIDSAIDVICGVYARLPLSIKKRFIPEPEISTQELANILTRINLAIKTRLSFVAHYLPTRIKNIITINGTVTFVVPGEFEITLTLPGETIDVKWKLLRVKILINDYEMGEGKELVHHLQLKKLHKFCQKILNKSRRPLIGVYNFLHDFCITLQFDLIFGEILNLTQGAYKNKVFISFCNVQKRYISIEYWRRGKAKKGSPTPTYQIVFSIPKKAKNGGIVVEYRPSTSFPVNFYKEFEGKPSVHDILKSAIEYNVYKKLILLKEELEKCRPKLVVKLTGDLLPKVTVNLLNINIQEEGCELSFGVNFFTGAYMCVGDELKESLLLKTIVIGLNNNIDVKKLEKCFDGIRTEFIMKKYVQSVNMLNVRLVVEKTLPSIFRKYSYFENSIKLYFQIIKEPQYYITVTFTDPKKKGLYINFFFLSTIEGKSTIIKLNPLDFYTPPKVNFQRRACLSEIGNTSNYGQKESLLQYTPHQIGAIINGIESKINMIAVCDEFLKKNVILSSVKNDCINNSPYIEIPNISKLIGSDNSKFFENMKDIILRNDSRFKHIWPLEYSLINTPIVEDFYKRDINGQGLVHLTGKKKCFHDVRSSGMLVPNVSFYEIITLALVDKMKAFSMLHKHVYQFAYAYYHYYNQYCRIKLYSYHKLIIAYGENKDQLVFLTYKANKDSFLLSFGQDLGQNFVNGDLNDWEYQNSSILWNPHNLVASFLAEKSGRKSFLLELVDYLINTTKPLTSLYNGIRHKIISSSALTQILIGESIYSEEFDIQLIPHSEYNFKVVCGRMTLEVFMYAKDYVYIKDSSYEKPKLYGLKEFLKSFGGSVIDIDTIEIDEVSLEKGARSLPESKCSEIEEILRNSSSVPCYTNIDDDKNNKDMSIKDITGSDGKYREEYFSSSRDLIKISHDSFDKLLYQDSTNKPISDFRNYLYTLRSFERLTTILVHNYGKPMLGGGGLTIHYANVTHHMVKVTFSGAKKPDGTIPCNINFIIFIQPKTFKIKLKLEYIGDIQPTADEISIVEEYFEEVMKYTESPQSIYSFMNLIRMTAPKFFSCITNLMLLQRTPDPSNFYTMNFEFVSIIQRKDELIPKFVPQILINELSGRILIPITIRPQKSDYNNKANDTNNKIKLDFVWEAANNEIYIHNANDEFFKMINQKIIQFNNTVKESLECTLEACIRYILKNEIKST